MLNHDGACGQCRRSGCPGPGLRGQCPRYPPGRGLRATARAQPPPAARGPAVARAVPPCRRRGRVPRRALAAPAGRAHRVGFRRATLPSGVELYPAAWGAPAGRRAAAASSPRAGPQSVEVPGGPLAFFNSDGASEQQARAVPPGGCHCGANLKRISLSSCQPEGPTDSEESGLPESPSRARFAFPIIQTGLTSTSLPTRKSLPPVPSLRGKAPPASL